MRTIPVDKADLSKLLELVERGEEVLLTRNGKPIAEISPHHSLKLNGPEWEKACQELLDFIERGVPLGGLRFKRGDLYDRD